MYSSLRFHQTLKRVLWIVSHNNAIGGNELWPFSIKSHVSILSPPLECCCNYVATIPKRQGCQALKYRPTKLLWCWRGLDLIPAWGGRVVPPTWHKKGESCKTYHIEETLPSTGGLVLGDGDKNCVCVIVGETEGGFRSEGCDHPWYLTMRKIKKGPWFSPLRHLPPPDFWNGLVHFVASYPAFTSDLNRSPKMGFLILIKKK